MRVSRSDYQPAAFGRWQGGEVGEGKEGWAGEHEGKGGTEFE